MTNDTPPKKCHQNQSSELITPEMREQVVWVKHRLEEYACRLQDLFFNLNTIEDAIFRAQESADCRLSENLFGACNEARKRELEQKESATAILGPDGDWPVEDEDGLSDF